MANGELSAEELMGLIAGQIKHSSVQAVIQAAKVAKANEVAEYWRSIAPEYGDRDERGNVPPTEIDSQVLNAYAGEYAKSIRVEERRDKVRVGSPLFLAVLLEWGSLHTPEYAPAARTVAHFNGQEGERGKAGSILLD